MFIGHLPAGYLWTRFLLRRYESANGANHHYRSYFGLGLLGSVLPDLDLVYFYVIDRQQHLHHGYWTHLPVFWLGALSASLAVSGLLRSRVLAVASIALISNVLLHLLLDTVVGKIRWLYPWTATDFVLFEVAARYDWWVWNFVLHWSFLLELALLAWAAAALVAARKRVRVADMQFV